MIEKLLRRLVIGEMHGSEELRFDGIVRIAAAPPDL